MLTRFVPLAAVLASFAVAQTTPIVIPAPADLLAQFRLRAGGISSLSVPPGAGPCEVRVVLAGTPCTLLLSPHDVRAPGFQLLVDDGRQLRRVPTPASITYRGEVRGLPGSDVAASLLDGQLDATIHLADGTTWAVQPLSKVNPALPRDSHIVYRNADVIAPPGHCGVGAQHVVGGRHQGGGSPTAIKICEIALDADVAYYNRFGSNTTNVQNQVTTVINGVGVIYRRDVEIDYTVTALIVRTTAIYNWGGSLTTLLPVFEAHWNANHANITRDTAHLFTGEGTFSGTVGLAYVGAICTTFGYGVSMAYDNNLATNVALVAHELGHNWNANHCDASPPCNIMCSGIGGCSGNLTSFDAGSVATIVAFKNTRTCLSDPGNGSQWAEVGDAEANPSSAQAPTGTGPLGSITGAVGFSSDVDTYLIRIVNEASFSATTVGTGPTLADTQLFLFDALGRGVVCNDDAGGGTRSAIDSSLVTSNGVYFLAVSGYNADPTNNGVRMFADTSSGQIAPNAGAGPMNGQTTDTTSTGTYAIILTGCEFVATTHTELGDAGDRLHTAQAPCQPGPLTAISGTFGAGDVDLYRIFVADPGSFSAATCGGSSLDTQLFLFDLNGLGVVGNDDTCAAQSTLTNALVTSPGVYYLGISEYNRDPASLGGAIFGTATSGQTPPSGPGGALPLNGWAGPATSTGAYTITLTGCTHAPAALSRLYGTGAGSSHGVPALSTSFPTQLGNNSGLSLTNPDPTAAGMAVILGLTRTSVPILNGTLLVGDMVTMLSLPAPPVGPSTIGPFRLSAVPTLCGSQVTWQAVIVVAPTSGFPTGLTWTNGVEWTFGL